MQKFIGVCVSQIHNSVTAKLLREISEWANKEKYKIIVFGCFVKMDRYTAFGQGEAKIFSGIPMQDLDVLILLGQTILDENILRSLRDEAHKAGTPVLTLDYELEGCYNISLDYKSTFRKIVEHVVQEHQRKNVFFVAGYLGNQFSDERLKAYQEVLEQNNLPIIREHIGYGDFWEIPAREVCEKWLKNKLDCPDAIICANDIMAIAVCDVLEEHKIRVPEDVIVTGFDNYWLSNYCTPKLTTAGVDQGEIVSTFFRIIHEIEVDKDQKPYDVSVPFHMNKRESCGCVPMKVRYENRYVMEMYEKINNMRVHIGDTFGMITDLTEEDSVMTIVKKMTPYIDQITADNVYIFVNKQFCNRTDISFQGDDEKLLCLFSREDGISSAPLFTITKKRISNIPENIWGEDDQIMILPLHWQSEVFGIVVLKYYQQDINYESLMDFMMALGLSLENVKKQMELRELYVHDALTELYNRRGFFEKLNRMMRQNHENKCAVLASVDLDCLKSINDNFGHAEGDVAIRAVADAMKEIEKEALKARFGGDEYVSFRFVATEDRDAYMQDYKEKLEQTLKKWNEEHDKRYVVSASCGMISMEIDNPSDIDKLMRKADDQMYQCKKEHHMARDSARND